MEIFNRQHLNKRFALIQKEKPSHELLYAAARTLAERLSWRKKDIIHCLFLGPYSYILQDVLAKEFPDLSISLIINQHSDCYFDSEYIPFDKDMFDCILSFFDVQWINDVPGHFKQLEQILHPKGIMMGVCVGNESFFDLGTYLANVEAEKSTYYVNRVHPMIKVDTIADLLKRAGFYSPISDLDSFYIKDICINDCIDLLRKIKATNAMIQQHACHLPKNQLEGVISIRIDFVYFTAIRSDEAKKKLDNSKDHLNRLQSLL